MSLRFCVVLLALAAHAGAHAFLEEAAPAVGSTVRTAPTEVRVCFTEEIRPGPSLLQVFDAAGRAVDKKDVRLAPGNACLLRVSLPPLAPGLYRVEWRAVCLYGHVTKGNFPFRVVP